MGFESDWSYFVTLDVTGLFHRVSRLPSPKRLRAGRENAKELHREVKCNLVSIIMISVKLLDFLSEAPCLRATLRRAGVK